MKHAVLVSQDAAQFAVIGEMLGHKGLEVEQAGSAKDLLARLEKATPDKPVNLILVSSTLEDMAPKALVEAVTEKSPFCHCVVAGDMSHKDFHDFYEGYGVLMQVSEAPDASDVEKLSAHLDKLTRLGTL
jgi:DNA-binding NtrC family response regulator